MSRNNDGDPSYEAWDRPEQATELGQLRDGNPFSNTRILSRCDSCGGVFWWTRISMVLGLYRPLDPRIEEDRLELAEMASNNVRVESMFRDSPKCVCTNRFQKSDDEEDDVW